VSQADTDVAYRRTLDDLYCRLPMFSRIGAAALKPSLDNTFALCAALGNPERRFPSVHIAGTNGKGSTSHGLAAILQAAGYKTGLYTSPHLVDFRERIRVDGEPVGKAWVVDFVARMSDAIDRIQPSFFEITVAMAFAAFAEAGVDAAVIETGLGGRLDSTNVISPVLSVITNIGYDHVDLLGPTLADIAREKAGIIKPQTPVVIGTRREETRDVFLRTAGDFDAPIRWAEDHYRATPQCADGDLAVFGVRDLQGGEIFDLRTDLRGDYQAQNIATILCAADALQSLGWNIDDARASLRNVSRTTGLRGRWEVLQNRPLVVADVAHNADGLTAVVQQWNRVAARERHIVVGFVRDKDVAAALALLPKSAHFHWCAAGIPRALSAEELAAMAAEIGLTGTVYPTVAAAVLGAMDALSEEDALLVTGSFFVVGEALAALEG